MCPKFRHSKVEYLPVKLKSENNFAKIVNELIVLKLFQLLNGDFILFEACLQMLQALCMLSE